MIWSYKFELPEGSYSISDIQNFFECILKKHEENIDNTSVKKYANIIENRITFNNKTGYHHELITPEIMNMLRSTENKITKNKNDENVLQK